MKDRIAIIISFIAIVISVLTILTNIGLFDGILDKIDDYLYWIQKRIKRH